MQHELFMQRCLQLAALGQGIVAPNPMVGAVIVHKGIIIGEGWHRAYGEAHAEPNAIAAVQDRSLLQDATLYVSLEPCAHHGKTPPCAELIIRKGIPRVVIGCRDSYSEVNGKGIQLLMNAGVEVTCGVLEEECKHLNRRFFTFHEKKRPYIILKWAQSADAYISPSKNSDFKRQISSEDSSILVHQWRTIESGILIGTNTALEDNPKLTSRKWPGKNPVRIVFDRKLRIPPEFNIYSDEANTIVINELKDADEGKLSFVQLDFDKDLLTQLMSVLYQRKLISVIVEGGTKTLQSFINVDLWDEAFVFSSPVYFGAGIKAPILPANKLFSTQSISKDTLFSFRNSNAI